MKKWLQLAVGVTALTAGMLFGSRPSQAASQYTFPAETAPHEGTWLVWPHAHTYGKKYAQAITPIWVQMTAALAPGEKVHIVVYDQRLEQSVKKQLEQAQVPLNQVDFLVAKTYDVWSRDMGPLFVRDASGQLKILDFGFDGWGKKTPYLHDAALRAQIAQQTGFPLIKVHQFVLEGGAVEISPDGTVLATKSAVISRYRNPKLSQTKAEQYLREYLGAKRFIWLQGVGGEDITDAHIDGFARFYDQNTIVTVPRDDFADLYEKIKMSDYKQLTTATNAAGQRYQIKELPLTAKNVKGLDYRGSYVNYYVGNQVVLLPVYGDKNDQVAEERVAAWYPDRKVVPINVTKLYKNGGMIHCVTQQQPQE